MSAKRVLLVEDEVEIREMLCFALEREGYDITQAGDAESALDYLDNGLPDIILLDWMLPGMNGPELVSRLRRDELTRDIPIIMLTARGAESDKLKGFDTGVDDFITKPFSPKELNARIRALLRRCDTTDNGVLECEGLTLDTQGHRLSYKGENIQIGPTEYRLLEFFMNNQERVYTREQLLDRVWGRGVYVEERTVDVHILRLRKLLNASGFAKFIQTVRGAGYRFSVK